MKLTPKQIRFIDEYMIDLNAKQAAIRAGYSEKTAYAIGPENLTKLVIKEEIDRRRKNTSDKLEITKESLILELLKLKDSAENNTVAIKAIEVINKMLGYYETKKIDVTTNGESINQITWVETKTYKEDDTNK